MSPFSTVSLTPLLITFALLLSGCQTTKQTPRLHDPMVGKIYSVKAKGYIQQKELYAKLLMNDIIYLGEKHDSKEHHELQYAVLMELVLQGKQPTVAFELFDQGTTSLLLRYQSLRDKNPQMKDAKAEKWLRKQLKWEEQDENQWKGYYKLIEFSRNGSLRNFHSKKHG